MPRTTEPVFNAQLAAALRGKYPGGECSLGAEQTKVLRERGRRPDIVVRPRGSLPVIVETEFEPARGVEEDARKRFGQTFIEGDPVEQVVAVKIPAALSRVRQENLAARIESAEFRYCVFSGTAEAQDRWPAAGWVTGDIAGLATCVELSSLSERRIEQGAKQLEQCVMETALYLRRFTPPGLLEKIAGELQQQDGEQTSRMAAAILANAFCFHNAISGQHGIPPLSELRNDSGALSRVRLMPCWHRILREVNYYPIFDIALKLLAHLTDRVALEVMRRLAALAENLSAIGATSLQDMSGRLFQRLISDRKFLATFYTRPTSSALLAELAVSRLERDWADADDVLRLQIGDLACGTGILIGAAYHAVRIRHRRAGGDDAALHGAMMEFSLIAADIMPAATHLTAAMLSSAHPAATFNGTQIITMPYGEQPAGSGRRTAIGSLDLIEDESALPLFGTGQERVHGRGKDQSDDRTTRQRLLHGALDLVIMNPPFTRPTNHESARVPIPSFAGFATSKEEQQAMSRRLAQIRRNQPMPAGNGNAGLGSNFVDLAHVKLAAGGVLALVLSATFLQGQSWRGARELLRREYRDLMFISIAAADEVDRAFSADTAMAEVLVIATRKQAGDADSDQACYINLDRRPATLIEAVETARAIRRLNPEQEQGLLTVADRKRAGNFLRASALQTGCAGLREHMLAQTAAGLQQAKLCLPRRKRPLPLPLTSLGGLGLRGLLHRDICGEERNAAGLPRGPFDIDELAEHGRAAYPALWEHEASRETMLIVQPDRGGTPRARCKERAVEVWNRTATRLHFNQDFQLNSQPLAACYTREPSMGGPAWPNFRATRKTWEKPLALWANTTLGLISFWWAGTRQHLGRARITLSALPELTVLDPRQLKREQITQAGQLFRQFQVRELLPANEAYRDEVRKELDRAVLVELLGLPRTVLGDLELLREQWCGEPSVHGGQNTRPDGAAQ